MHTLGFCRIVLLHCFVAFFCGFIKNDVYRLKTAYSSAFRSVLLGFLDGIPFYLGIERATSFENPNKNPN
jgi:hypothetical protein